MDMAALQTMTPGYSSLTHNVKINAVTLSLLLLHSLGLAGAGTAEM